jgi:signal peptidase I
MLLAVLVMSGLLVAVLAIGTAAGQWRLAPVLTGSMTPTVPQDSLVLAEPVPVGALRPGDILLFNAPVAGGPLVMHRVQDLRAGPHGPIVHTKGDANAAPDAWTIRVRGTTAWRVKHSVPYVGKAVRLLSQANLRVLILVLGVVVLVASGLRAIWSGRRSPESPSGSAPPVPTRRDRRALIELRALERRSTRRVLVVLTAGALFVGTLGVAGLAYATFTHTPTPAAPALGSGSVPTPTGFTCRWATATTVRTDWTATSSSGFVTGYHVKRSNTSGSGYATVGTVSPESTVTYTDTPPAPVTTLRYYVVTSFHTTWDSAVSTQSPSNTCIGSVNRAAGTGTAGSTGDGSQATSALLNTPSAVAVDASNNIYIADTLNNKIRKVTASTGVISTIAGTGTAGSTGDGGQATSALLNAPRGIAVDASNNVYIADTGSNKVRKITASTGVISMIAGTGTAGNAGDGAAATSATLSGPRGVAVDTSNNVYIADTINNRVRKITVATGFISAFAGAGATTTCSFSGTATSVSMSAPAGVAVDSSGTVYIADTGRNCIRKVVGTTVSQVAGGGATTTCGTVAIGSVSLSGPTGVAVDSTGRVVFTDNARFCIRMVSGANVVAIAGTGTAGFSGDNGPAIAALVNTPTGIAANASGDVWFSDTGTTMHSVRRIEGVL